jgi:internalin A
MAKKRTEIQGRSGGPSATRQLKPQIDEALRRIAKARETHAEELDLGGLGLAEIPIEVLELRWLKRLYLGPDEEGRQNRYRRPDEAAKLRRNGLGAVPIALFQALTNLEELDLSLNQLAALPPEIAALTGLQRLSLANNQLAALPPEIAALTGLQWLWLNNNQLAALPPEIAALTGLQELLLNNNQLAALPPEIAALTGLRELWLANNQLAALPPEIAALTGLQRLLLNNNQLAALPPEIAALTGLQALWLANNPLVTPPPEVVAQGVEAIRAYLREFSKDAPPFYEAKIVLVGEGAVGKTTLKERLLRNRFATPSSTRGMEMEVAERPHPVLPGEKMTLNFWDFGGQEDYRPAQQFFFSKDALYIMVWHARDDATRSNVEAWMRLIRHRVGPEARVLVVATHADAHPSGDSVRQLCDDKFRGMAVSHHKVDSENGKGAEELWEAVNREVAKLNGFGAKRPRSWIDARDAILARRSDAAHQMPFEEFHTLATGKGVADDAVQIFAAMLANQGRIVYHGDDRHLAGTVVLDPEWLMKVIAYVITDVDTQNANGVLPENGLARIWLNHSRAGSEKPIRYGQNHWNHLLRMTPSAITFTTMISSASAGGTASFSATRTISTPWRWSRPMARRACASPRPALSPPI